MGLAIVLPSVTIRETVEQAIRDRESKKQPDTPKPQEPAEVTSES